MPAPVFSDRIGKTPIKDARLFFNAGPSDPERNGIAAGKPIQYIIFLQPVAVAEAVIGVKGYVSTHIRVVERFPVINRSYLNVLTEY